MSCDKVVINGPDLKKMAQKKNQIGKSGGERKKNPSANPDFMFCRVPAQMINIYL